MGDTFGNPNERAMTDCIVLFSMSRSLVIIDIYSDHRDHHLLLHNYVIEIIPSTACMVCLQLFVSSKYGPGNVDSFCTLVYMHSLPHCEIDPQSLATARTSTTMPYFAPCAFDGRSYGCNPRHFEKHNDQSHVVAVQA